MPGEVCLHEPLDFDWQIDQESMCFYVYEIRCENCGAVTKPTDPELILGPWESA
jgi:hypothetical protein